MQQKQRKNIAIIGVGLIGGSLAIRLHETKLSAHIIGVDQNPDHIATSLERELIDEALNLDQAIAQADVIILAIPVNNMTQLLPQILDQVDQQIVIDLGSTKSPMVNAIANHPKRARYLAAHPMWGTEYSGPQAAIAGAFQDKAVILCNIDESDPDVVDWATHMFTKIGMNIVHMDANAHDIHAAYISHISHVTSFALANTVLSKEQQDKNIFTLASAGFESTVRLAKSNAAMWAPIFLQNRDNVLDVLAEHIQQLQRFQDSITKGDEKSLIALIEEANQIKKIIR